MQNESETEFHRVYKVSPTQQLTKLTHLLRESGVDVTGSVKFVPLFPLYFRFLSVLLFPLLMSFLHLHVVFLHHH